MCNGHDCNVALISGASARLDKKKNKKTSEQITPAEYSFRITAC